MIEKFRLVSLHRRIDSNNRGKPIASIHYINTDESEFVCERVMVFYCSITSNNVWGTNPSMIFMCTEMHYLLS